MSFNHFGCKLGYFCLIVSLLFNSWTNCCHGLSNERFAKIWMINTHTQLEVSLSRFLHFELVFFYKSLLCFLIALSTIFQLETIKIAFFAFESRRREISLKEKNFDLFGWLLFHYVSCSSSSLFTFIPLSNEIFLFLFSQIVQKSAGIQGSFVNWMSFVVVNKTKSLLNEVSVT